MICSPKDLTAATSLKRCTWNKYLLSGSESEAVPPRRKGSLSCRDHHCCESPFLLFFTAVKEMAATRFDFRLLRQVAVSASVSCVTILICSTVYGFKWCYTETVAYQNKSKQESRESRVWNPIIRSDILMTTVQITMQIRQKRNIFQETFAIQCWISACFLLSPYLCRTLLHFFLPQSLKAEFV